MLVGCSSQPKATGIAESSQMERTEWNPQVMVYKNPDVDFRSYKKVIIDPVQIYTGPDAKFNVSQEQEQEMANYLYADITRVLQEKGLLTTQPGPGVARLKLVLAGLEKTRPVASVVSHALPIGLALNLGKGAMGKNGSFMGTATVGGEFTDSTTGNLIASFLAKEAPNAMDVTVMVSEIDASKKAIDKVTQQIGDRLEEIQLGHH
ncbi:MAG: DUF3313 domain-containing protein [Syntrophorhabdales bacterium]